VRYQGKITEWRDDQGFGFITPNGGGQRVFVHIKSFSGRQQRPVGDEIVTYELGHDPKGRPQAHNVAFVLGHASPATSSGKGTIPLMLTAVFVALVAGSAFTGRLPVEVAWLYLAASFAAFLAYALDKSAARNGQWRTRESTLHLLGLAGGWPGALLAQRLIRHKSSKQSFQTVFRITVILNCAALAWLFSATGSTVLRSTLGAA
jgi:uncharacterized membrane protein YsdA (DUF1294 family)/cold shock CspA family protein